MIINWIDEVSKIFEIGSDGRKGMRSFRVFEKNEFPEKIPGVPCVLSYPTGVRYEYSLGGARAIWKGRSDFYLVDGVEKSKLPWMIGFFARIITAASGNMQLSGTVEHFMLDPSMEGGNVQGPVVLNYGGDDPYLGIVAYWEVKEDISDEITPSA